MITEVNSNYPFACQKITDGIRASSTRGSAAAVGYVHQISKNRLVKTSSGKTTRSANRGKNLKEMNEKGQVFQIKKYYKGL